jgi:Ca2+-binding RTX toxin-like protein
LGYEGDDTLFGNDGNDVLVGGLGNDQIAGGIGSDEYRFGRGEGKDVITESPEASATNVVVLGPSILPSEFGVIRHQNSLVLFDLLTDTTLEIKSWWPLTSTHVQKIIFANGVEWSSSELTAWATSSNDFNSDGIIDSDAYAGALSIIDTDMDDDGLTNAIEVLLGLNPLKVDSDDDGISDLLDTDHGGTNSAGPLTITIHTPSNAVITN